MENQALYYEHLKVGDVFSSPARTVTEADVVAFAGLSGDYNALHVDKEYAKKSMFGTRVAHGLLGLTIASGLFTRTDLNRRLSTTLLALLGLDSWNFLKPLYMNDTIHLEIEITDKKKTENESRGVVFFTRRVINQNGEVIQQGVTPMLIKRIDEIILSKGANKQ